MKRAGTCLMMVLLVWMLLAVARAEEPEHVRPPTGTVDQLRSALSAAAHSLGDKLDKGHDFLYRRLEYLIQDVDSWFAEGELAPAVAPVSPLRIGLDGAFLHRQSGFGLATTGNFAATFEVPNLRRRLKLFITSDDLQESPRDPLLEHAPVRAGLRFAPGRNIDVEFGVRPKLWPSVFGAVRWASDVGTGKVRAYPFAKAYVETGLGLGLSGGVAVDHWDGRWVVRSASYANWVRNTAAVDWSQTALAGYAKAVIQQRSYDRLADGHDLACGVAARVSVAGDRVSRTSLYEASVLFKRPLHGGWLFAYGGPVVRWERTLRWHPDIGIGIGVDALFWGLATRPAELRDYCR